MDIRRRVDPAHAQCGRDFGKRLIDFWILRQCHHDTLKHHPDVTLMDLQIPEMSGTTPL
jgi:CheY-like chemotaxis protein